MTGIPFEDSINLQKETGILIDEYYISKSSSEFIYNVIEEYGGRNAFYSDFYMSFVCPIGIVKNSVKGNEINCNYYESKKLKEKLYSLIITNIEEIINLGSGENYAFLKKINEDYNFFEKIEPLEHPRYIMQYNSKRKDEFLAKYLRLLRHGIE